MEIKILKYFFHLKYDQGVTSCVIKLFSYQAFPSFSNCKTHFAGLYCNNIMYYKYPLKLCHQTVYSLHHERSVSESWKLIGMASDKDWADCSINNPGGNYMKRKPSITSKVLRFSVNWNFGIKCSTIFLIKIFYEWWLTNFLSKHFFQTILLRTLLFRIFCIQKFQFRRGTEGKSKIRFTNRYRLEYISSRLEKSSYWEITPTKISLNESFTAKIKAIGKVFEVKAVIFVNFTRASLIFHLKTNLICFFLNQAHLENVGAEIERSQNILHCTEYNTVFFINENPVS